MADEVASLVVKITGDASQLERTISQVQDELSQLEKASNNKNSVSSQKENTAGTEANTKSKKKNTEESQKNTKAATDNVKAVAEQGKAVQQKSSIAQMDAAAARKQAEAVKSHTQATKENIKNQQQGVQQAKQNIDAMGGQEKAAESTAKKLGDSDKALKGLGTDLDTITKPLQYGALALAAGGVASAKFAIDFEDNFANVKKTVDGTPEQLEQVKQSIIDLSTSTTSSTKELTDLAAIAGQLGIKTENISGFTEMMAKMGVATNLYGEEGAATLAKFANVTKMSQEDFDKLGSSIVDLGNHFATTEADIAAMGMRLAGAGTQLGLNQADILGIATSLSSVGIEAEMGGSAFSKAMINMQMASATGFDQVNNITKKTGKSLRDLQLMSANDSKSFKDLAGSLGMTNGELNSVVNSGLKLENFAKITGRTSEEFKNLVDNNPAEAIDAFIKGLQNADKSGSSAVEMLQEMGFTEVRLRDSLLRLANSEDGITKAVQMSNEAWGENVALNNEFNAKMDTTASKMAMAKNNIVEAGRSIGEAFLPIIGDAAASVAGFAQGLANMNEGAQKTVIGIGATIIGLGAAAKGAVGVTKGIGALKEAFVEIAKVAPSLAKIKPILGVLGEGTAGLGGMAATSFGITAAIAAPMVATLGVYKLISNEVTKNIEKNTELGKTFEEAYDKASGAKKQVHNIKDLQTEYKELNESINSGTLNSEKFNKAQERQEEIAQWLKDNGTEEVKVLVEMGEIEAALSLLEQLKREQAEAAREELENRKPKEEIEKQTQTLEQQGKVYHQQKQNKEIASQWLQQVGALKDEYAAIRNDESLGVTERLQRTQTLTQKYRELFDNYELLTGNRLNLPELLPGEDGLDQPTKNIIAEIKRLNEQVNTTDERISKAKEGLNGFSSSAQKSAIELNNFNSVQDVFKAGGDAVQKVVSDMKSTMESWGMSSEQISTQIAVFKNGFDNLNQAAQAGALTAVARDAALAENNVSSMQEAWEKGGPTLDGVVSSYINLGQQLGLTAEQSIQGAALIKEGFLNASDVGEKDIPKVVENIRKLGETNGIEITSEKLTQMAQSMGLIPDNKKIEISADGNVSIIEKTKELTEKIDGKKTKVSVNADGNITILNKAGEWTTELEGKAAEIKVNADGNIDVLDEAGNKIAEIDGKTGVVTLTANDGVTPEAEAAEQAVENVPEDHNTNLTCDDGVTGPANSAAKAVREIPATKKVTLKFEADDAGNVSSGFYSSKQFIKNEAKGTKDFEGGLAVVNDERGVADPRELIEHNGQHYIFEGRDVVVPLARHDKVYTAKETKQILSGEKLPRYASGKGNKSWDTEKSDFDHRMKTSQVSVQEQLNWWNSMLAKYKKDADVVKEVNEEIYKLSRDLINELNEISMDYIAERTALNDWAEDGPIEAFYRMVAREDEALESGKISYKEYTDTLKKYGQQMYDERFSQSEKWLDQQVKYNGMSTKDYIAGLDRMRQYTEEYIEANIISYQYGSEKIQEIENNRFDALQKLAEQRNSESEKWIDTRNNLNDWDEDIGAAYQRIKERNLAEVEAGRMTWGEYTDTMLDFTEQLVEGKKDFSDQWIEHEKKYNSLSVEGQRAALQRERDYVEKFFADIGELTDEQYLVKMNIIAEIDDADMDLNTDQLNEWRDAASFYKQQAETYGWGFMHDDSETAYWRRVIDEETKLLNTLGGLDVKDSQRKIAEAEMNLYTAQKAELDKVLEAQRDYIDDLKDKFAEEEQALRDSWTIADRKEDMADVQEQLEIYKNATTNRGQEKYKELQDQMKQLQRDEELYQLEKSNNAIIEQLEFDLKAAEDNKMNVLNKMLQQGIDIQGVVNSLVGAINKASESIVSTTTNTNTDNRIINIYAADGVDMEHILSESGLTGGIK